MANTKQIGTIPGLIIAALAVWGVVKLMGGIPSVSVDHRAAIAATVSAPVWTYDSSKDEMTGKPIKNARMISANTFNLEFPYQGAQHATLMFRRHPRWGFDAALTIDRGQMICGVESCTLQVRFDDAAPQAWIFAPTASHDSTTLFVRKGQAFANRVAAAKRVRIEMQLFQQAPIVADFPAEGLKLDRMK